MKNILSIIFANILLAAVLAVSAAYFYPALFLKKTAGFYTSAPYKKDFNEKFEKEVIKNLRKPEGLEYSKSPIVILGCSYAYGQYLKDSQTIGHKLAYKAHRPVYNFAFPASGIQHAYYIIKNMPEVSPEPQYIFYFFIGDQIRRMYINCTRSDEYENLQYQIDAGRLIKLDNRKNIFDNIEILYALKNNFIYYYKYTRQAKQLFKNYMLALKNAAAEKYPNAEFYAFYIPKKDYKFLPRSFFDELKKEGINIVMLNKEAGIDFRDEKYSISKSLDPYAHPSELYWEEISNVLIEKFNL